VALRDITCATFSLLDLPEASSPLLIGLYFYYAKLISTLSQLPARIDLAKLVYFTSLALGAVAIVLVLGLWNMMARPRPEVSQTLMRWRVALQFIALCLVMAALYLSAKS